MAKAPDAPGIDVVAQALSDPRRVQILDQLATARRDACCSPENPDAPASLCACDIAPALGDIPASKLGYHLKQLRQAGLVVEQQRGKWVYYTLNHAALEEFARAVAERWTGDARARRTAPVRRGARRVTTK